MTLLPCSDRRCCTAAHACFFACRLIIVGVCSTHPVEFLLSCMTGASPALGAQGPGLNQGSIVCSTPSEHFLRRWRGRQSTPSTRRLQATTNVGQ